MSQTKMLKREKGYEVIKVYFLPLYRTLSYYKHLRTKLL